MTTTEHILLESDTREMPDVRTARKSHARAELRSLLRGHVLQLEIIDYYYLAVRARLGSTEREFVLDLRFVHTPRLARHIAWRWIGASLSILVLCAAIVAVIRALAPHWWRQEWPAVCGAAAIAWIVATYVALYRTTETVSLFSTYGVARVLQFTGGPGTLRRARPFVGKLAAHIRLAAAARRRTKGEHLRDEMREHQRLKDIGVLSEDDFQTSKARILRQHSPSRRRRPK
jgi:hypothetical protein